MNMRTQEPWLLSQAPHRRTCLTGALCRGRASEFAVKYAGYFNVLIRAKPAQSHGP